MSYVSKPHDLVREVHVKYGHGCHSLHDGDCAWQNARIVSPSRLESRSVALLVDRVLLHEYRGDGFESYTEIYVLSVAYPTLYASATISLETNPPIRRWHEDVVLLTAAKVHIAEALTIFKSLDSIDREHTSPQSSMQFVKGWLAKTYGASLDDAGYDTAYRVAGSLHFHDEVCHALCRSGIGAAYVIFINSRQIIVEI